MRRLLGAFLCSVLLVALPGIEAPVFAQSSGPMETYERLKQRWDEKQHEGITRAELKRGVERFWTLRETHPGTEAAAKATKEAFRLLNRGRPFFVDREGQSVSLMQVKFGQVGVNEPVKAQLLQYVPHFSDTPLKEWRHIGQQSERPSVRAAALFQVARHNHRYSRYEKAESQLDSLSVQYGVAEDHPRYGSEIAAMRRDIERFAVGRVLPPLRSETLSGDSIDTRDLRGTVTLLYFYGSTCGACIPEYPVLNRLHAKYNPQVFRLIGIPADASGLLTKAEFRDFMKKYDIDWPQAWEAGLLEQYNVFGMPTAMLLNRTGQVVWLGRTKVIDAVSELEGLELSQAVASLAEQ
jgi:thiol-disulfide isomerase/thioredoxin